MKRFHAHVRVDNLQSSIRFYSTLFGVEPAVLKPDYAKWILDDPRINFAITAGTPAPGIDHLGMQVDSDDELAAITRRLDAPGNRWQSRRTPPAATRKETKDGWRIRTASHGRPSNSARTRPTVSTSHRA